MGKLEEKILPFAQHSACEKQAQKIHPDTDHDFLLETALNAFPDLWAGYAESYIQEHPEFLSKYGLIMPHCDDSDFEAFEILAMQITTRRDAVQGLKQAFIQNGEAANIIKDLLEHPVMQHRIQTGETLPLAETRYFDAA